MTKKGQGKAGETEEKTTCGCANSKSSAIIHCPRNIALIMPLNCVANVTILGNISMGEVTDLPYFKCDVEHSSPKHLSFGETAFIVI